MFSMLTGRHRHHGLRRPRRTERRQTAVRRLQLESLESRQLLSGTPANPTLVVVDDAAANASFRYSAAGAAQGSTALVAANAAPRGVATMIGVDQNWVLDAARKVFVYDATGALLGSWTAGSMANNAAPEGIATDGTDVWIVDSRSDKIYRYAGAASRLSGSQNAASSFNLASGNSNPKGLATDGASLWVADDAKTDRVFKYRTAGTLVGSWTIDSSNKAPTGLALDPANVGDVWIADSGTDRVYKYAGAAARNGGSQASAGSFALGSANKNAQGLAVAGRAWAEAPHEIEWVRQFGTAAEENGRQVTTDGAGHIYLSGRTNGALSVPNPDGVQSPYLAQFDAAGNINWIYQSAPIPGDEEEGVGVAADGQGNVFQVIGAPSHPSLRKYDSTGALLWTSHLPDGEAIFRVAVDEQGDAYMSSYTATTILVRKFDGQTGAVEWSRSLDTGGANNSSGIVYDGSGHVYVVGYTYGSLIGPNAGFADGVLAKYTTGGDLVWTRQFGTAGMDFAFNLAADSLGNVYAAGSVYASMEAWNLGDQDIFITKWDAAGNMQWRRQLGTSASDAGANLVPDGLGNLYFSGTTSGALAGPQLGNGDIVVGKYNAAGDLLWFHQYGTTGAEGGSSLTRDALGNFYLGTRTNADWGGPNAGGFDAVLVKLAPPAPAAASSTASTSLQTVDLAFAAMAWEASQQGANKSTGVFAGGRSRRALA
jgi:sugar lactone lactonase YvrE